MVASLASYEIRISRLDSLVAGRAVKQTHATGKRKGRRMVSLPACHPVYCLGHRQEETKGEERKREPIRHAVHPCHGATSGRTQPERCRTGGLFAGDRVLAACAGTTARWERAVLPCRRAVVLRGDSRLLQASPANDAPISADSGKGELAEIMVPGPGPDVGSRVTVPARVSNNMFISRRPTKACVTAELEPNRFSNGTSFVFIIIVCFRIVKESIF